MNALANSGLSAATQACLKADFGTVGSKYTPLPCCRGAKKPAAKPRAKKK